MTRIVYCADMFSSKTVLYLYAVYAQLYDSTVEINIEGIAKAMVAMPGPVLYSVDK